MQTESNFIKIMCILLYSNSPQGNKLQETIDSYLVYYNRRKGGGRTTVIYTVRNTDKPIQPRLNIVYYKPFIHWCYHIRVDI